LGVKLLAIGLVGAGLGGCATSGGGGNASLPAGETCQSIRSQLSKLDARGVRSSVEAQAAGRKITPQQKADADAYNRLLNDYLGAKCHVA
jgi:hypothetical protein